MFPPNALLSTGFNYAVPRVDGPLVDRTVNELSPSQNMPDSTNATVPLVSGPRVDPTVDELSPSKNMPDSTYINVPLNSAPLVDRTVSELSPPRNILGSINLDDPLLMGLVSIGQSANYRPRGKCPNRPTPLFALLQGHMSIVQSASYRPRRTRLIVSPALFPASLDRTVQRRTNGICFVAAKAAVRAWFCFKSVKPYCPHNALLGNGFNYAVPAWMDIVSIVQSMN